MNHGSLDLGYAALMDCAYIELVDLRSSFLAIDRWSFKPVLVALMTVAALRLVCQLPGWISFLMIPLSFFGYVIASVIILAMTVYCFIKKRPRRGTSVFLALLLPVLLWWPINWFADLVHLGLTAGFGVGQLGIPSKSNGGGFAVYDWSVGFAGGPNTFLIHDVTGEITLPMAQHTHPSNSELGFGEECAGKVRRLVGHYYVCSF